MTRTTDPPAPAKRPYRAPILRVHGDFRKLTASKGGVNADGPGKPNTKVGGPNT